MEGKVDFPPSVPISTIFDVMNSTESQRHIDQEFTTTAIILLIVESFVTVLTFFVFVFWEIGYNVFRLWKFNRRVPTDDTSEGGDEIPLLSGKEEVSTPSSVFGMRFMAFLRKRNIGVWILSVYRVVASIYGATVAGLEVYESNRRGKSFFGIYQHMTSLTIVLFTLFYVFSSMCSVFYLIHLHLFNKTKVKIFDLFVSVLEYVHLLFFELVIIGCFIVMFAFWCLDTPNALSQGEFHFDYLTIPLHGGQFLICLIELFLLCDVTFFVHHAMFCACYVWGYSLWTTMLVKVRILENFPYQGLLSYDTNWWAIPLRFGMGIFVYFIFFVFWVVTNVRGWILSRTRKTKWMWKNRKGRKIGVQEVSKEDLAAIEMIEGVESLV